MSEAAGQWQCCMCGHRWTGDDVCPKCHPEEADCIEAQTQFTAAGQVQAGPSSATSVQPSYTSNVATDTRTLLRDADAEIGALAGGPADTTVSMDTAVEEQRRKWWAIALCAVLSATVQRDHCAAMASPAPSPWYVYPRALFCFLSVPFVLWALCDWRPALLGAWACAMAVNLIAGNWRWCCSATHRSVPYVLAFLALLAFVMAANIMWRIVL